VARVGTLESFKWEINSWSKSATRPQAFRDVLGKNANSLKYLNLGFAAHEIDKLATGAINPIPYPLTTLELLNLDLSGAHGDDGKDFDMMLRQTHKLRSLTLNLPGCDLENCRIRRISYEWNFPRLTNLDLSVYVDQPSGLVDFLSRHSTIKVLGLRVDSEEPVRIAPEILPNLSALRKGYQRGNETLNDLLSSSRSVAYLHLDSPLYGDSFRIDIKNPAVLRCLEIESISWVKLVENKALKELVTQFRGLQEFGLTFQSEDTSWKEDDGSRHHPESLNVNDLVSLDTLDY
jgi:hypothetical protein